MNNFFGLCLTISKHSSLPIDPPPPVTNITLFEILYFNILFSTKILGLSTISKKSISFSKDLLIKFPVSLLDLDKLLILIFLSLNSS